MLEPRRLLDGNDPVIVLVEPVQNYIVDDVLPYLWINPDETVFDPHVNGDPPPDNDDADENGYADDAYGWNFLTDSPMFAYPDSNEDAGHGTVITNTVLNLLPSTSRVKIMYVITHLTNDIHSDGELRDGSEALDYILEKKLDQGVNIVAVATLVSRTDRAGAAALNSAGIVLIGGVSPADTNFDNNAGVTEDAFFNATPRAGVQAPALDNIIPVTTDPSVTPTAHGINSFYGADHTQIFRA